MQEIWVQSSGSDKPCLCSTVAKSTDSGARQVLFEFWLCCCSVTKSCLTFWDPMGCRLPCPSRSPGACSNSCPLSRWCYHFVLSFPSPPAFSLSQHEGLFQWVGSASSGQSTGASALASVLPMNIQDWFPSGLTGWLSLQSKGLSRVFSGTTIQKHQFFSAQPSLWSNSHICL